ncbi:MAG: ABC transporter ATP-binding protein [Alcaligenaceae bacterium]|nr:ABC transporter ATP-binding protein [Alcaligenaceae bacterium]
MTSQHIAETRVSQPPTLAKRSDESTTVPENVLEITGLTVDIATPRGTLHVVRDVSLHVKRGETLCIVGESGCGKSMTSLAIMGLLPKSAQRSSSRFQFLGEELSHASKGHINALRGKKMAMIFQEPMTALNPAYTIGEQLTEHYRHHLNATEADARARAVNLLEKVGIASAAQRLGQYPHQLSGGLRQRVMIAMSLMCNPELLIADEPSTALDVTIQAQILRLLADLQKELGIAMVLITHDLGVVARIADRVAVMYAGQIVEQGSATEIFSAPQHPYTRGLISCIPIPGRTIPGGKLGTIPGVVPSLLGDMTGCAFRDRCASALAACSGNIPVHQTPRGHQWRCVLEPSKATAA